MTIIRREAIITRVFHSKMDGEVNLIVNVSIFGRSLFARNHMIIAYSSGSLFRHLLNRAVATFLAHEGLSFYHL